MLYIMEQLKNLQEQGVNILQSISSKDKSGAHLSVVNDIIVEINDLIDGEQFDLAIVYADRYESFALCLLFHKKVPILHIEAGDITQGGTMDDSVRHAISRLVRSKNFLIDSREEEWRVFHCGLLSYSNL